MNNQSIPRNKNILRHGGIGDGGAIGGRYRRLAHRAIGAGESLDETREESEGGDEIRAKLNHYRK